MAAPTATITLGGTDISSRVGSPGSGPTVVYGRGASFDGAAEPPGYCTVVVKNNDRAFNPRNGSSPLVSLLKIGQPLRLTAVYSATTYYLFHGFLRRIVPLDDGFAELHCQDALFNFSRREASVAASVTRSISGFRGAILDAIGEAGGSRNLSNIGPEQSVTYTGADGQNAAGLLAELNRATGTIHFIKPTSTGYQYTTLDRTALQGGASLETFSDTDLANPFAVQLGQYDYTDERVVNQQRVTATPRALEDTATTVWTKDSMWLSASQSKTRWAEFEEPTFEQAVSYTVVSGSGTVTLTPFARSAKLDVVAGAGGFVIKDIVITGRRALLSDFGAVVRDDSSSQTQFGLLRGSEIESDYIFSEPAAEGLGDWYLYRYATPRAASGPVFENRFPSQLARDIGDRITYTASEHSLSGVEMLVQGFKTSINLSADIWQTEYQLEEMPAAVTLFTVGGSAGQGVGGTGVLAI